MTATLGKTRNWWILIAILVGVRGMTLGIGWDSFRADPDAYRALAATWHDTGTFGRVAEEQVAKPTAYRPPLYPWLLSWVSSAQQAPSDTGPSDTWWIATLHWLFGVATCLITFDIARRLNLPSPIGGLAALLVACDPILLRQSTLVMTETTATLLAVLVWWLALQNESMPPRKSWSLQTVALGGWMGVAVLCRPTAWAWIALWWALALTMRRWQWLLLCAFGTVVVITPWALRNRVQLGSPIVTTTHGGYTLYLANNPVLYEHWKTSVSREWDEAAFHGLWRNEQIDAPKRSEVDLDRLANDRAWSTIMSEPAIMLRGLVIRTGWLWAMWPSQRQASLLVRVLIGGWYIAVTGLALVGGWQVLRSKGSWSLWMPGLLLVVSLTCVHSVYWSNMRMRAPAIPAMSLLASVGISALWPLRRRANDATSSELASGQRA